MTAEILAQIREELLNSATSIQESKQPAYTNNSVDVLTNFKSVSKRLGISPMEVWAVYFNKHVDAINTYVSTKQESEPIESRFADIINYCVLGLGLITEDNTLPSGKDPNLEIFKNYPNYRNSTIDPYPSVNPYPVGDE